MPHPAQPQHTKYWAPRTRKRHQQEHRPQWPTESGNPPQHAKGRTGDCPGPRKGTTTRRNVTQGVQVVRARPPGRICRPCTWTPNATRAHRRFVGSNLMLIGATNRREHCDPALLSRFENVITFPLPQVGDRRQIFGHYARHLTPADLDALARKSDGLSGRNIKNVCSLTERRWISTSLAVGATAATIRPPPAQAYLVSLSATHKDENGDVYVSEHAEDAQEKNASKVYASYSG